MTLKNLRFPAEWEPQSAILLAWPHAGTDWADRLSEVEDTYIAHVAAIARFQHVVICVADDDIEAYARARLASNRIDMARVTFIMLPYNDTWLRDTGPISLACDQGFELLDFRFTGWGGKFEASEDDLLVQRLHGSGILLNSSVQSIDFALEGGAIETDGRGSLLTTRQCLQQRHPSASREELDRLLCGWLRQERVLWLERGYLMGDDTDAHVDTLARFAPDDAIVFQACDDPADPHHEELAAMAAEIAALRTPDGRPYRLFPLPWPKPVIDEGRRLAASYANYLVINGAVLMPAYGDPADALAAEVLAAAHPGREVVQVPCRSLIWQNGSLHCISMQLPAGLT